MSFAIISNKTEIALQELINQCFQCNREADRMVSILGVNCVCPQISKLLHQKVAHYYPNVADIIGEKTLERYNISVKYGSTNEPKNYPYDVKEICNQFMLMVLDFQSMLIATLKISQEENDIHVYADLLHILEQYNEIVEQLILLVDKSNQYTDMMAFDHDVLDFWILGE